MSGIVCVCPFTLKLHFATVAVPFPVSVVLYFAYAYIENTIAVISNNASNIITGLFLVFVAVCLVVLFCFVL